MLVRVVLVHVAMGDHNVLHFVKEVSIVPLSSLATLLLDLRGPRGIEERRKRRAGLHAGRYKNKNLLAIS